MLVDVIALVIFFEKKFPGGLPLPIREPTDLLDGNSGHGVRREDEHSAKVLVFDCQGVGACQTLEHHEAVIALSATVKSEIIFPVPKCGDA